MAILIYVIAIVLFMYIADLAVCYCYCKMKKKKDRESLHRSDDIEEQKNALKDTSKQVVRMTKQALNGWMIFRVKRLGRIPSQKYRTFILKHIFQMDIADKVVIYSWDFIRAPWNISIGRGSVVGNEASLDGRNFIRIGENVNISTGIHIYTEQHDVNDPYFRSLTSGGEVVIENRAWISSHTTILPKVHICEGAILASGALAAKNLDAFGIYGGVPARKIGERSRDLRYEFNGEYLPFI